MSSLIDVYSVNKMSYGISYVLLTTVIKGAIVFAIVYLFMSKTKCLSPKHRHLFWLFAAASCLLAPFLSAIAYPLHIVDPSFLTENRNTVQAAFASFLRWYFPYEFKTVWQMESGSYFCINKVTRLHRLSWESWAAIVWAGGSVHSLAMILAANLRLTWLARDAPPAAGNAHTDLMRDLTRKAGIGGTVRLLYSDRCRVPFVWNILNPTVFLPTNAARWSRGRLRAVLTHELAHVKRRDFLTQLVSRTICSFLWFVPFVWVSHSNLHMEQEKACDELTVRGGTKPAEYAGHLIALARTVTRRDNVYAGIFLSSTRRSSLEKRIVDLLKTPGETRRPPLNRFVRPFLLCALCCLPFLFIKPGLGEARRNYIAEETALQMSAGTWVNREYGYDKFPPLAQKIVLTSNCKIEEWSRMDNLGPNYRYTSKLVRSWVGKDGYLYCNVYCNSSFIKIDSSTELWRFGRSGAVWERMYRGGIHDEFQGEFPEIVDSTPDPRSPDNYAVYYRE